MSEALVNDLATTLRNAANRSRGRGMRVSFEWLCDTLDGDETLTRQVLMRAGFTPPMATEWAYGKGCARLADHCYPELLADHLTDILDDHDTL